MGAVYEQRLFQIRKGVLSSFVRDGANQKVTNYFCSNCGSLIYHQWFNKDEISPVIIIKLGTLGETSWLNPACHVWTKHAQPWLCFKDEDILFEEQ